MRGGTHVIVGFVVGMLPALAARDDMLIVPCAAIAAATSLLPDLDEMESLASNAPRVLVVPLVYAVTRRRTRARMLVGYLLWRAATALAAATTRPLSRGVRRLAGGHRRGTHAPVTVAALGLLALAAAHAGVVPPALATAAWLGYLSHATADACTVDGVAGPWPRDRRRVYLVPRRLRVLSGGRGERRLLLALIAPFLVLYATALAPRIEAPRFTMPRITIPQPPAPPGLPGGERAPATAVS